MRYTKPQVATDAWYSTGEACRLFAVSRTTLSRWIARGKLRARVRRVNNRLYISGEEILRCWRSFYA